MFSGKTEEHPPIIVEGNPVPYSMVERMYEKAEARGDKKAAEHWLDKLTRPKEN